MAQASIVRPSPIVLSMEVSDDEDNWPSEYRLLIGKHVKYLTIMPGTFERDVLSFPLPALPQFRDDQDWTKAQLSRGEGTQELLVTYTNKELPAVSCTWHAVNVDCLALPRTRLLSLMAYEATSPWGDPSSASVVIKIARFEWELPRMETETEVYQRLEGSNLAPRFLSHVTENGRVMGFVLEKLPGRPATLADLSSCEVALGKLHRMGLLHGDVNRHNFLVTEGDVRLIDFENAQMDTTQEARDREMKSLQEEFVDESGRGGGFIFEDDE